jgi:peptidoglycan/xylan/chitin deacetylase (PgdA/CDA1 family)
VLKQEQEAGAEIGTHMHIADEFPCNVPQERRHLEQLTSLYEQVFGTRPCSYRAGRYGMSDNTLAALAELGYKVDSSVTPHVNWSAQGGPDYRLHSNQPYWEHGILEVPITILGMRSWWPFGGWSKYRWLRPSVATAEHLRWIVDRACETGLEVLNMTFHTMELIPRASPYVRTQAETALYLRRLEKTVAYMIKRGFEATTLSGLYAKWGRHDPVEGKVLKSV